MCIIIIIPFCGQLFIVITIETIIPTIICFIMERTLQSVHIHDDLKIDFILYML